MIVVDAGPLVALIDADDKHHQACADVMKKLRPPLITVWLALTEAMYLLEDFWAQDALWQMVLREVLSVESLTAADMTRMRDLMAKYWDLPMDLADAGLVAAAERLRCCSIGARLLVPSGTTKLAAAKCADGGATPPGGIRILSGICDDNWH